MQLSNKNLSFITSIYKIVMDIHVWFLLCQTDQMGRRSDNVKSASLVGNNELMV